MRGFIKSHPWVNFIYLIFLIFFVSVIKNPVLAVFSLLFSLAYVRAIDKIKLWYVLFIILAFFIINPLVSHEGMTVLFYLPDKNPLTKESVIYGLFAGITLSGVILSFSFFQKVMTGEKLLYVTRRFAPSVALIFSMVLSFVPRLKSEFRKVIMHQKTLGYDIEKGSLLKRGKILLRCISAVFSYETEKGYELSLSMKRRGYGVRERKTHIRQKMRTKDKIFMVLIILSATLALIGWLCGCFDFQYYPIIKFGEFSYGKLINFLNYIFYLAIPYIVNFIEVKKWKN